MNDAGGRKQPIRQTPFDIGKIERSGEIEVKPATGGGGRIPASTDGEHLGYRRGSVERVFGVVPGEGERPGQPAVDIDRRAAAAGHRTGVHESLVGALDQNRIPAARAGARIYIANDVDNFHAELFNPGHAELRQAVGLHPGFDFVEADVPGRIPNAFGALRLAGGK